MTENRCVRTEVGCQNTEGGRWNAEKGMAVRKQLTEDRNEYGFRNTASGL